MTLTSPMGSSSEPGHEMRITTGGSIDNYVNFATDFLLDNPQRYLILHTLPSAPPTTPSKSSKPPPKSTTSLHSCTTNIPRLISVVETIKRSLTQSSPLLNQDGTEGRLKKRRRVKGVWQYNESGSLVVDNEESVREDPLLRALSGNSKMLHRPYLRITLSTRPLGLEKGQNVTCQYTPNRPSKGESFGDEDDEQSAWDDGMPLGDVHSSLASNRPKNQKRKSSLSADEVGRKRKKGTKDKRSLRIGGDV